MVCMYYPSAFVLMNYVICINCPFNGMNVPSVHVCYRDLRESVDIISESDLNCLNVLNGIGP